MKHFAGIQDDFLIMVGGGTLLSAPRSALILYCTTASTKMCQKHVNQPPSNDLSPLPGLLEAKSLLSSIKQEGILNNVSMNLNNCVEALYF